MVKMRKEKLKLKIFTSQLEMYPKIEFQNNKSEYRNLKI